MSLNLSAVFVEAATAPVVAALRHFDELEPVQGFEALAPASLRGALEEAIRLVAKRAHAKVDQVRALLPQAEIVGTLRALEESYEPSRAAVHGHSQSFVPPLNHEEGEAAETTSEFLTSLSERFAHDEHIAVPLGKFASDIRRWEKLLARMGAIVGVDRSLVQSHRRGRQLRWAALAFGVVVVAAAVGAVLWMRIVVKGARERVDATLAFADPCAWEIIQPRDLRYARDDQKSRLEKNKKACEKKRARAEYEAKCEALASQLDAGKLTSDDVAVAGSSAALLQRIAKQSLESADLMLNADVMPCQDTPAGPRFWEAFAHVAMSSAHLWGKTSKVSDHVASVLIREEFGLTHKSDDSLAWHTERVARRAIRRGHASEMEKAKSVCAVRSVLGLEQGDWCKALARATKTPTP